MKKLLHLFVLLVGCALLFSDVSAKPKVLLLHADEVSYMNDVKAKLTATNEFDEIANFDIRNGNIPSLALLQSYDAVLVWSNYSPSNGVGNVIVNYIDQGGKVVVAQFAINGAGFSDNFTNAAYRVLTANSYGTGAASMGTVHQPSHPIMKNVTSFNGGGSAYRAFNVSLTSGSYRIADWTDGLPLIAANEKIGAKQVRRVDLNFFPPSSAISSSWWQQNTDGGRIMANALLWVIGDQAPPARVSVNPETVDFGGLYPGTPSNRCVTIRSLGPGTLKINKITLSGSTDFTIVSAPNPNDTLQIGLQRDICVRFTPSGLGSRNAQLIVETSGLDSGVQVTDLRGMGSAPTISVSENAIMRKTHISLSKTGSVCIPMLSTGSGPIQIDSIRILGRDADAYFIVSAPASVPQGEERSVCVGFRPNFEGRTDALIKIYSNAYNKREVTIPAYGVGILGRFKMTPSALDFDSVNMGARVCKVVSFTNPGTDTVRILDNYIASTDPDYTFTRIGSADTVIRPGDSVLFNVCFEPKKNGTRVARYLFYTDIPMTYDAPVPRDTSEFELDIIGVGVPFGRLAMKNEVFAPTAIGDEICMTDTLRNGGLAPVTINSATITGENGSEFTMSGLTFPLTLGPGEGRMVTLCLTATVQGARTGDLTFSTMSEGMTGNATFELNGVGLLNCAEATPLTLLAGHLTMVGLRDTEIVRVINCGEIPHTYTASLNQTGTVYSILGVTTSTEVLPGSATVFTVVYTPTAIGASPAAIEITGGPAPINVTLSGSGGGVLLGATGNAGVVMKDDCRIFDIIITNNGNVDWTPGTGVIGGTNRGDFTIESGPTPSTIVPGGTAVVTVKFCASLVGNESATLNFPDGSPVAMNAVFPYNLNGQGIVSSVSTVSEMKGYQLGQIYPNPVSSTASVRINLPYSSTVTLNLVSATGQSYEMVTGRYPMGESTLEFTTSNLPSGTYFYVLSNDEVRISRQLTIVR